MADEQGPAYVSFAGGAFSGRVDSQLRESAQQTWYNLVSIDTGGTFTVGAGATIGASQISQATGYQIQAAVTQFNTVTPGVTGNGNTPTAACVLPQTNRPFPFTGMLLYIVNNGANPFNVFPSLGDVSGTINGAASVILGVGTITAFTTVTPGIWWADGIGEGAANSITTTVSQGTVAAAGSTNANATPIVQALANVSSSAASQGVQLPVAVAGLVITLNPTGVVGNTPLIVYPANGSGNTINGSGSLSITLPVTSPTIFYCFVNGAWVTK